MRNREAYVHMHRSGQFVLVGRIMVTEDGRFSTCAFQYANSYLARADAVSVDPALLPLQEATRRIFDGPVGGELFGGISDACPDSWGRHVLDTAAGGIGITLTPFDYVLYAGPERIGALGFSEKPDLPAFSHQPAWASSLPGTELDLEDLLQAADAVGMAEDLAPRYRRFFVRGSSLGGARPKAAVELDGKAWIAKFGQEREAVPTCRLEHGVMQLARLCGIKTPQTRLVSVMGNRDILLVERFDRHEGARVPFVSARTLTGMTEAETLQGASYADIAVAMRKHCQADYLAKDLATLYTRMVFNICCNNSDDHLRNHGFLYHDAGKSGWRLSPAYDVVPQPLLDEAPMLHLAAGPRGREASLENAIRGYGAFGLLYDEASSIAAKVKNVVAQNWEPVLRDASVPLASLARVRECFAVAMGRP